MTIESLEAKIIKAQDRLISTKKAYEDAAKELKDLLDKRDAIRKEMLYDLLVKS